MTTIQVFDPPMCCSSGVCGPGVDPALARFAADLEWLRGQGVAVERFNLAQQPGAFAANPAVKVVLARSGTGGLPLILVDGRTVSSGTYPERETLAQAVATKGEAAVGAASRAFRVLESPARCTPSPGSRKCC